MGKTGSRGAFWAALTRFDQSKISQSLAIRNTVGFAIPVILGAATHSLAAGIAASIGALNVSFSDTHEPYVIRAQRMLAASVLVGLAVACGGVLGGHRILSVVLLGCWGFGAGMLVSLSTGAADLGTISLVTICVYAGIGRPVNDALLGGLLAFCGGLLQTALTLALWPLRRHGPERNLLANVLIELEHMAATAHMEAAESPPATGTINDAQNWLASLRESTTVEAERLRSLLAQAERIRISLLALRRIRSRIRREPEASAAVRLLDRAFEGAGLALHATAGVLRGDSRMSGAGENVAVLDEVAARLRETEPSTPELSALVRDARTQVQALAGRLRAASELAAGTTPAGAAEFDRSESRRAPALRLTGTLATIRANLDLHSTAFRHALRLGVSVAIATAIGREIGIQRAYWMPMTAAIVLKPDFTATFTRGILRITGTFVGLVATTAFFHFVPAGSGMDVAVVIALMLAMRWVGGANYGILVVAVTALVVALLAMTGVAPGPVMAARAVNTVIGGLIALVAYGAWPTWERTRVADEVASTLDAYGAYFRAICIAYEQGRVAAGRELTRSRVLGRRDRTNLEASVARVQSEPRDNGVSARLATVMAASHRMIHAMMALEAGLEGGAAPAARPEFARYAEGVRRTLALLVECLRTRRPPREELPNLRELHTELARSFDRYSLLVVETDRITNSLDTIAEQVLAWVGQ